MSTKISSLTDGVTIAPTDLLVAARGGANVKLSASYITTFINAQPADANLTELANLNALDNYVIVGNNLNQWTTETGATARASLGVAIGADVQAYDAKLTSIAAVATNGLVTKTAASTYTTRTIQGANGVTVANGDGVSSNPTVTLGGSNVDFNAFEVSNFVIYRPYYKVISASVTGTYAMDINQASVFNLTLTGNTTISFMNAPPINTASSVRVRIAQDGVGARVTTWSPSIKWSSGMAPTLPLGANAYSEFIFNSMNQGVTWEGSTLGLNFS